MLRGFTRCYLSPLCRKNMFFSVEFNVERLWVEYGRVPHPVVPVLHGVLQVIWMISSKKYTEKMAWCRSCDAMMTRHTKMMMIQAWQSLIYCSMSCQRNCERLSLSHTNKPSMSVNYSACLPCRFFFFKSCMNSSFEKKSWIPFSAFSFSITYFFLCFSSPFG